MNIERKMKITISKIIKENYEINNILENSFNIEPV